MLPGFRFSLSFTLSYMTLLVFIPLAACFFRASQISWVEFQKAVWNEQARAAYSLTFGASFLAAVFDLFFGLLIAWALVRYEFPGKRLLDSLIDLPFALPTAVAGLVYSMLYSEHGWLGKYLVPMGIELAYTRSAVVFVLTFIGLPFIVRTIQPVLETFEPELEEAAASLGASRWQTFRYVILPTLYPAIFTGFALAFARGLGEYGSVVFVSGNIRGETEIAPMLIVASLEGKEYGDATAVAVVLLLVSFAMLVLINWLQHRSKRNAA